MIENHGYTLCQEYPTLIHEILDGKFLLEMEESQEWRGVGFIMGGQEIF